MDGGLTGQQRRRQPYNTKSNKVRVIKTPGGELRYLHLKKKGTAPKCGDCGTKLAGVRFPFAIPPKHIHPSTRKGYRTQHTYSGYDWKSRGHHTDMNGSTDPSPPPT